MDTAQEKTDLRLRTMGRNTSLWVVLDKSGYADSLESMESVLNTLSGMVVEQYLTQIDADYLLEADWRNRLYGVELEGLKAEQRIAIAKFEADAQVLALKTVGENALLAAKAYDVLVQDLIMAAKEYAAALEAERLQLEVARAQMAVRK